MKTLPLPARLFVSRRHCVGAVLLVAFFPLKTFRSPWLFLLLLTALVGHIRLQGESAARAQRIDDVGVVRGGLRVAAVARAQRDDDRGRGQCVEPVHVPDQGTQSGYRTLFSMACLVVTVQAAGSVYGWLGGMPGQFDIWTLPKPLVGAATAYFLINTAMIATAIALVDAPERS